MATLAAVLLVSTQAVCEERRILMNWDGGTHIYLKGDTPPFEPVPFTVEDLRYSVQEATPPGHQLDTLLLCVNGGQAMYYPSEAGTKYCAFLTTQADWDEFAQLWPGGIQWYDNLEYFFGNGIDPWAIIFDEAQQRGLETMLTYRMNDRHNMKSERTQFWYDNPDKHLSSGGLNFDYAETRDYVFGLIQEAVQRYDSVDGIELDFNRTPEFFTSATPQAQQIIYMNDLVQRVRNMLDVEGAARGKDLLLSVRAPTIGGVDPTYAVSLNYGVDPVHWADQGWIDFLAVSEYLREDFSLPIQEWKALINEVPIYGGIEAARGASGSPAILMSLDDYRQAAAARWSEGADGLYMFNFHLSREWIPGNVPPYDLFLEIGDPSIPATFTQEDPGSTLPGYVSNTWDISTDNKWLSAELRVQLNEGNIYQDPAGSNNPPNPAAIGTTLEFDSYMAGGYDTTGGAAGTSPTVMGGAVDIGGDIPLKFGTFVIDATWGSSLDPKPSGDLMLARVTLSDNAQGTYSYQIGVHGNAPASFVGGFILNGAMMEPILTATFNQENPGGTLSNYVSNTWNVDTLGEKWLGAELLIEGLTPGDIYQDPDGSNTPPTPALIGAHPTVEFDSYMTGGYDTDVTTGPLPTQIGGAVDTAIMLGYLPGDHIPLVFNTEEIDATWVSSLMTKPSGDDLMLGRVTLLDTAQGTFKFRIGIDNSGKAFYLGGVIIDGEMLMMGPGPLPPPGDADGDFDVDDDDATILAGNWQQTIEGGYSVGDFDEDGDVDDADATILATNWGVGVAAAVPEPSTMVMLATVGPCLLAGLYWRRRPEQFTR